MKKKHQQATMIIKEIYSKPETEVIEIEATTSVMVGSCNLGDADNADKGTSGYSKKRNIWED